MPEFEDKQSSLHQARKRAEETKRNLFAAQEQQKKVQVMRGVLQRRAGDEATDEQIAALDNKNEELAREIGSLKSQSREHSQVEQAQLEAFLPFADPTKNISKLNDRHPILLFPVRIETRFKKITRDGSPVDQLWVRVYPDDIAVDTFEEFLADIEIKNARIYWTNIWKAAGNDPQRRAAWQSLVKRHGAGRANWILQQVQPTNIGDQPTKVDGDWILVVVSEAPLPPAEKPFVQAYWRDVWLAHNDQTKIQAALDELLLNVAQVRVDVINAQYVPQNLQQRPEAPVTNVRVEFLELPQLDQIASQQQPWSRAARTAILPERFVLLGFNGDVETMHEVGNVIPSELVIGPNPSADATEQLRPDGDDLVIPDELKWMVDFDEAVAKGMGFRVDLSRVQARAGFDRLFVLGVRLSADIDSSKEQLETLIANHQRSRKGFCILPQGAPTNNVDDDQSGYTWLEDSDASYEHYFVQDVSDDPADWQLKKDGRWLAEYLGIDAEVLKASPNYFATDQCESRAMNIALWPATLGSFMETSMEPVFEDRTIDSTREFFNRYVRGRGAIPSIRVGNQPYGILPATPFSRMNWINRKFLGGANVNAEVPDQFPFLIRLYQLILKANEKWSTLQQQVSYVGKRGADAHQVLLDVLGLHPSSVEFYQRYGETFEQLMNRLKYTLLLPPFFDSLREYVKSGVDLLAELGYDAKQNGIPEVLKKFFLRSANMLKGPLVDDSPLSETDPIRAYTEGGDDYIQWLISAARDSHDALRLQKGFVDNRPPSALLYLMLQHALDVSYVDVSFQLHLNAKLMTQDEVLVARQPPKFMQIQEPQEDSGSQWKYLYKAEPAITGDPNLTIAQFIPRILTTLNPYLQTQIQALEHLQNAPTARLERVFAEHTDCCTYRLDAWWLGLVNLQLGLMRSTETFGPGANAGSYLGAFGWLEDVRSERKELEPVELDEDLAEVFRPTDDPPLTSDEQNLGYIHAPSLNHAVTAAVLRNGYLANATKDNPDSLAINLTSERVRVAMGVIEGIRNGQSLSALLGYQFERGLHDQEDLFLDAVIFEFRNQFSLAGNRLKSTATKEEDNVAIESIEARNVVDGLALIEHVQAQPLAGQVYPFGLGSKLPDLPVPPEENRKKLAAINAQVQRIMNINDAVADLSMAESVYQVVQGNYSRAAGTLEAFSKGNYPPTPEVVQTPRSGVTLTHRVGLQLKGDLDPTDPAYSTPRSKGEPAINDWLSDYLPSLNDIVCEVEFFDHGLDALRKEVVTPADLGLLPIDVLYSLNMDNDQQMRALDDHVLFYVIDVFTPRPDAQIKIMYRVKATGKISFFELAPYLRNLRTLLLSSRPLRATDVRLPNEASASEDTAVINEAKITTVRDLLVPHGNDLQNLLSQLNILLGHPDPAVVAAEAIDKIDQLIADYQLTANAVSRFGLPSAGHGFAYDWRRQQFAALMSKLNDFIDQWDDRLSDFDQRILDFATLDPATTDDEKFKYLLGAGRLIWTTLIDPLPATPDLLRVDLQDNKRSDFVTVLNQLKSVRDNQTELSGLVEEIDALAVSIAKHDSETVAVEDNKRAAVAFVEDLKSKTESLSNDIAARLGNVTELLSGDPEASSQQRIDQLSEAIKQVLGEEFVCLAEFTMLPDQSAEWQNAWDHRDDLLEFLQVSEAVDFPVDDWLYGVSRVRDKLHHLESAIVLAGTLNDSDLALQPLQFPYHADDLWLGLQFPQKKPGTDEPFQIDEDKLLYTAHYHKPFNSTDSHFCGLLIDEWTEVIPTTEETTGLTFHYDRPNSEPPQVLLLATPAEFTGQWTWQDLVDTLHETLNLAKQRAVEPQQLHSTSLARFLPAISSEVATWPITKSLNFSFNNQIQYVMKEN